MEVGLFKKFVNYTDKKTGEERTGVNFYLRCNSALIPIEVSFFPNKETGKDPRYSGRKEILSVFADTLPDFPSKSTVENVENKNNVENVENVEKEKGENKVTK